MLFIETKQPRLSLITTVQLSVIIEDISMKRIYSRWPINCKQADCYCNN